MLSLGVAGVRPPGGVGSGQGDGCPTRVSQNCAGCRLGAVRLVAGAGSRLSARPRPRVPGRWKGEELHWRPGGEPGGFQVPGKPGVLAFGGGFPPPPAPARATRPPGRTLLAATASCPPALGSAGSPGGLRQPSLEPGCTQLASGSPAASGVPRPGRGGRRLRRAVWVYRMPQRPRTGATGSELLQTWPEGA